VRIKFKQQARVLRFDVEIQPELTFRALSLLVIVFLAVILVVLSLVSMWKENRFGWPLRGMIWFTVAIIGSCGVIAILAGYEQKARSIEKVTHRVEAVTFGLE
jgi:Kef-type K+ transport system membrane component KefB